MIPLHRVELHDHLSGTGGSASQYEVVGRAGVVYEEMDKVRVSTKERKQPRPHQGEYELTQCAAYGPVNRDTLQ